MSSFLQKNVTITELSFNYYCFLLLFIAGARFKHLLLIVSFGVLVVLCFAGADALGIEIGRNFTWVNRVESFLNNDPNEANQYNYAIMAIATGGTTGVGIGNTVMARFLSESHNDFIFSVILEQGGIVICIIILLAYFVLFYRCLLVSREAKGLFGAYEDIEFDINLSNMIGKTNELLPNKPNIITEASFSYDNNFCSVDILKNDTDGVEIYEVKSSTKVKDIYLDDAAYQYYVLSNLGYNVKKVGLF